MSLEAELTISQTTTSRNKKSNKVILYIGDNTENSYFSK